MARRDGVVVAYSGGADSSLLMAVAHEVLGDRALACIGSSPSYPKAEREAAVALAESLGARWRVVETAEHLDAAYSSNGPDRCYHCKLALFRRLRGIAAEEGLGTIVDGHNVDDLGDDRPGRRGARELGVLSPLTELGFTKRDVREAARILGLASWDRPAMACLASRVPTGTEITPELLARIEAAEDVLRRCGFRRFRVRHAGDVARIELPPEDMERALALRSEIAEGVKRAGWRHACLDLAGLRPIP